VNIYIGIDPGLEGAIAFLRQRPTGGVAIDIRDMPIVKIDRGGKDRRDYYPPAINRLFGSGRSDIVVVPRGNLVEEIRDA